MQLLDLVSGVQETQGPRNNRRSRLCWDSWGVLNQAGPEGWSSGRGCAEPVNAVSAEKHM